MKIKCFNLQLIIKMISSKLLTKYFNDYYSKENIPENIRLKIILVGVDPMNIFKNCLVKKVNSNISRHVICGDFDILHYNQEPDNEEWDIVTNGRRKWAEPMFKSGPISGFFGINYGRDYQRNEYKPDFINPQADSKQNLEKEFIKYANEKHLYVLKKNSYNQGYNHGVKNQDFVNNISVNMEIEELKNENRQLRKINKSSNDYQSLKDEIKSLKRQLRNANNNNACMSEKNDITKAYHACLKDKNNCLKEKNDISRAYHSCLDEKNDIIGG